MKQRTPTFLTWYSAIVLGLGIVLMTGLVPDWGKWYSSSMPYRMQTESLLRGEAALSYSPSALELDLVWFNGTIQQGWGLGVPIWRLPFEALARLFGLPSFPDRLALAVAIILFTYGTIRIFTRSFPSQSPLEWLIQFRRRPDRPVTILLLVMFPPIITLCSGPFNVYEEAVLYGYLYSMGLFLGLLSFQRRPRFLFFLTLSLFAGLAGFVRPTIGAYGLITVLIAMVLGYQSDWRWWRCLSGMVIFCLGGALLYWANYLRFGSGLEFGHNLNMTGMDAIYLSRFGAPFDAASFLASARELVGSLFGVRELNGFNTVREDIVWGQVPQLFRWRHFYVTTYDLTFFSAILITWGCAGWFLLQKGRRIFIQSIRHSFFAVAALWSLMAFVPLFLFYSKLWMISSRYMIDFAPAIAVAMTAGVSLLGGMRIKHFRQSRMFRFSVFYASLLWLGWQIATAQFYFGPARTSTRAEVLSILQREPPLLESLPSGYSLDSDNRPSRSIYHNGSGWEADGTTGPVVVLFIEHPEKIVLEVESSGPAPVDDAEYDVIQARIGLEPLALESIESTEKGKRLVFSAPVRDFYRQGMQVLFLAFAPPEQVLERQSQFRLLTVKWN